MATRWHVPCGCKIEYVAEGETITPVAFAPCPQHESEILETCVPAAQAYCKQIGPLEEQ